jgi:sugar (pentulose or hexulose) kinase
LSIVAWVTRVLALDVGTSSIRAAVCGEDGEPRVGDLDGARLHAFSIVAG